MRERSLICSFPKFIGNILAIGTIYSITKHDNINTLALIVQNRNVIGRHTYVFFIRFIIFIQTNKAFDRFESRLLLKQ
jgi:hypothetical protein